MKAAWLLGTAVATLILLGLAGCAEHAVSPQTPQHVFILPPQLPLPEDNNEPETLVAPTLPHAFGPGEAATLVTWRCTPAQDLIAAFPAGRVKLWSKLGYYELPELPQVDTAEAGTKYQKDDISFWNQDSEALIGNGSRQGQCQIDAERTLSRNSGDNARFHALGSAPAWTLTLANDTPQAAITLGQDSNDSLNEFELPYDVELNRDGHEARFIATGNNRVHDMRVEIAAGACFDRTSGEPYPTRVTLMLDGQRYEGCGEALN
ncbi:hypothetical protein [Phytohalomonas tamaricis]|uniref:hypothetical protein n=1 Tax=Phytohalomonas tamaricis TaxID=2081032 RepID=UPI000D0B9B42|nr:hypothetical protein [Phytohalomonas tamaricis]